MNVYSVFGNIFFLWCVLSLSFSLIYLKEEMDVFQAIPVPEFIFKRTESSQRLVKEGNGKLLKGLLGTFKINNIGFAAYAISSKEIKG